MIRSLYYFFPIADEPNPSCSNHSIVKIKVIYHTKSESQSLVQLKCFVGSEVPVYQANNLKQEISTIAYNLEHVLSEMIAEARESVA